MNEEIERLQRKLAREQGARKQAEKIAEEKTREIYYMNSELRQLNDHLEELVKERTAELMRTRDEAIEANLVKSQFLANMSHELRTPLNAIIGYSEMLKEEAEEIGEQSFVADLEKVNKAGKHLLSLINDILDISKIEAGKVELYYESCQLQAFVQDVITTIQPLIAANGNVLTTRCVDGELNVDVTKLRQILINLLSNASKFTKDGNIVLEVVHEAREDRPGYYFKVEDSGIGMNEEQLSKLFQPFTQADSSTTRKYGGTGLGLAISQRFCQIMNGEIAASSKPGEGSTFTFWLPAEPVERSTNEDDYEVLWTEPEAEKTGDRSVLIIDDELSSLNLMKRYLDKEGWQLAFAQSGQEGLRLARKLKPSVICLDILMPSMDGWAVLTELKNDAELANIPVIILSMTSDKKLGFALGASEFITKPVRRDQLIKLLDKYVPNRNASEVLVIEDDITTSEMMTKLLEREGYRTSFADNGRTALGVIAQSVPQLILLDLMMPEMDGFQFVVELRKREEWKNIPIVVVTAKTITAEDRLRLNGSVEKIIQKGSIEREKFLQEVSGLIASSFDRVNPE